MVLERTREDAMREEVLKHQQVIQKYLGRYSLMGPTEANELEEAYREMRTIQERCYHEFNREQLFTSDEWVCEYCGAIKRLRGEQAKAAKEA